MMNTTNTNFTGLYGFVTRHPRLILACALLLSVLSVLYTKSRMEFLTGRDDLMPSNTSFNRDYRTYLKEFGDQEEIVAVIECDDSQLCGAFGDRLYAALSADKKHFRDVFYPFGLPFFKKNGLLFMPPEEIRGLKENLTLAKPVLKALSVAPSVQTLFTTLTGQMNDYVVKSGSPQELKGLTFMLGALGKGFKTFGSGSAAPSSLSLEEFFFSSGGEESQFSKAGKTQILTALPVKDQDSFVPAEQTISLIRKQVDLLKKDPAFKGVKIGLTGTPVLEYQEMSTSQHDIAIATVVSLVLTVILLLAAFRGVKNVFAAMVSLIAAVCVSFGFATLTVGHLNILSMVFAIMLIGIGIEYGIQVVLRYQEERAQGRGELEAVGIGLTRNIWAIVMAAATVAAAFLTFVFTDFRGIKELGIIAAGGVVICVISTFTVLPAMMVLMRRGGKGVTKQEKEELSGTPGFPGLRRLLFGRPRAVAAGTIILCLASLYPLSQIIFDYNLMNLQAKGLESVEYAYKLMRSKENSGYFAVVIADSLQDVKEKTARLEKLPSVDHVVSLLSFVPDKQQEKLADLAALRAELADVKPVPYEEDLQLMELPTIFEKFRDSVVALKTQLDAEKKPEAKQVGDFLAVLDNFFKKLEKEKDKNAVGMLKDFQGGMFASLPEKIAMLKESLNASPVTLADVPPEMRARFVGKTGKYLLQVAPKKEIFDRGPLKEFIDQVRSVAPHATGEPVMVYESMTIMRDAYRGAFIYAFIAIVGILLLAFRSVRFALIGLVPLVVGVLFMVAGMWLFGISFNSANIIVMPLVLGIAVDSGIYIINRYRREDETPEQVVTRSTGRGVIYNTLTIMASFGALMVAHHQGVFSIGAVMSLGMVACQIAFILVLPAVLTLAGKKG